MKATFLYCLFRSEKEEYQGLKALVFYRLIMCF